MNNKILTTFDEIIELTLKHEGGYVNDPNDLGGDYLMHNVHGKP